VKRLSQPSVERCLVSAAYAAAKRNAFGGAWFSKH
jgi:hypothetical protein